MINIYYYLKKQSESISYVVLPPPWFCSPLKTDAPFLPLSLFTPRGHASLDGSSSPLRQPGNGLDSNWFQWFGFFSGGAWFGW